MIQFIVVAIIVIALLLWLRRWLRLSWGTTVVIVVVGAALAFLTLTGRMNWLFTLLLTAALAVVKLVRSPVGFLAMGWLRRFLSRHPSGPAVFRSPSMLMRIDPFSGIVDGEILEGEFAGMRLSQLSEEQLAALLAERAEADPAAARIINFYIRYLRRFGFGGGEGGAEAGGEDDSSLPSLAQACEILGVKESDSWRTVTEARRRLLSRLHPDKGGSSWITQRINAAWQVLGQQHPNRPPPSGSGDDTPPDPSNSH